MPNLPPLPDSILEMSETSHVEFEQTLDGNCVDASDSRSNRVTLRSELSAIGEWAELDCWFPWSKSNTQSTDQMLGTSILTEHLAGGVATDQRVPDATTRHKVGLTVEDNVNTIGSNIKLNRPVLSSSFRSDVGVSDDFSRDLFDFPA